MANEWQIPEPQCLSCFTVWGDPIMLFDADGNYTPVIAANSGDGVCWECKAQGTRLADDGMTLGTYDTIAMEYVPA